MKRVFICSPFKALTPERQALYIEYAKEKTLEAIKQGYAPYTPHLYLTSVLNDNDPYARHKGFQIGYEFMKVCDEIWVCARYDVSNGMRKEVGTAGRLGLKIVIKDKKVPYIKAISPSWEDPK